MDGLGTAVRGSTTERDRTEDAGEAVRREAKAWLAGRLGPARSLPLVLVLVVQYTVSRLRHGQACKRAGELREEDWRLRLGDSQVLIYRSKGMSRWGLQSLWWRASVIVPSSLGQEPVFKKKARR